MEMFRFLRAATVCVFIVGTVTVQAEESPGDSLLPDFYNDATLSTSGIKLDDFENSSVDYFSGTMSRSATDFSLPGNGGMNLAFRRSYNSQQPYVWPEHTALGVGWNMDFGWVEVTDVNKMCNALWSVSIMDNPVLHMPDGSTDVMAMTDASFADPTQVHYRGRNGMGIICGGTLDPVNPFIMVGPDGTRYEFERWSGGGAMTGFYRTAKWFVKKVADRHGNWLWIDYADVGDYSTVGSVVAPVRVTTSDGRDVTLEYENALLKRIMYGTQPVVEYTYAPSAFAFGDFSDLVQVRLREELVWNYTYSAKTDPGAGSMTSATNPFGGRTDYTWQQMYFQTGDGKQLNSAVVQVAQSGFDTPSALWSYAYAPASVIGQRDVTTVTAPEGVYQYTHFSALGMVSGEVWKVGLKEKVVFTPTQGAARIDEYTWSPYYISSENNKRTSATGLYAAVDQSYYGSLLVSQKTTIGSKVWTTASSNWWWDLTFIGTPQAQTITTTGPDGAQRVLNRRYEHRPDIYVYFLLHQEWTSQAQFPNTTPMQVDFNTTGDPVRQFDKGFYTFLAYDDQGNLASSTRGLAGDGVQGAARITRFSDYYLGVARRTEHPDATVTLLEVDPFGRTVRKTDRDGKVMSYAYDGLGRVTQIDYPLGNDTFLSYSGRRTQLTRGIYRRTTTVDGFGRNVDEVHADTASGRAIRVTREYDGLGRTLFTSYPDSPSGTRYEYDDYSRVVRATHPGGFRAYTYLDGDRVEVADENGNVTSLFRDEIEGPGKGDLVRIDSPEGIVTRIQRNEYGLPLRIEQGDGGATMLARINNYSASLVLLDSTEPESGHVFYNYDYAGNVMDVFHETTPGYGRYQHNDYDLNDRVVNTTAPTSETMYALAGEKEYYDVRLQFSYTGEGKPVDQTRTETVSRYDGSNQQTFSQLRSSTWHQTYDGNGNLQAEQLTANGNNWEFDYTYDANDRQATLTYPGNERVAYAPDAFGWPTRAGNYATSVHYHESGQLAGFTYGNGRQLNIAVNDRFLVGSMSVPGVSSLSYDYDPAGNVVAITDGLDAVQNVSLGYDGMNRLVAANGAWGNGSFAYDKLGNITQKSIGSDALALGYDARNRLTSMAGSRTRQYSYDWFGNIALRNSQIFGYDGLGNLMATPKLAMADGTKYQYDARGRRLATVANGKTTYSLYANGDRLLYEDTPADGVWQRNIHVGAMLVARNEHYIACYEDIDGDGIPQCAEVDAGLNPYDPLDAAGDKDGDGLTNLQEYQRGTAINNADTDGDGMGDAVEVSYGLDPKVNDANGDLDGDGLPNIVELARGFNPANPADGAADADNDGLSNAQEYALGTDWTKADTDGDGMKDGAEVAAGLNPLVNDANGDLDADGLPNGWEVAHGLNPNNPADAQQDPDGDGVSTLVEYQQGTDPFVADVLPPINDLFVNAGGSMNLVGWVANPYAQSYTVDYGILGQTGQQSSPTLTTTAFEHPGVLADTLYWYSVRARNAHGEVSGRHVVAMPGVRQQYAIPASLNSVTSQIARGAGDSAFFAGNDAYGFHLAVYRDGLVSYQDITASPCASRCWELVASESGDALLVWAGATQNQQTIYSAVRYSWASGTWGNVEQLAVVPTYANFNGYVHANADEYGNFRVVYASNWHYLNYYANGYPRDKFTLYLASAYRGGSWNSQLLFTSADASIGDVRFGSTTEILLREHRNTTQSGSVVTFTPEERLYLMRQGASSWSTYNFATNPGIRTMDIDRNLLTYRIQNGSSSDIYGARICGDACLQGNAASLATISTNNSDPGPFAFDGNGLGQVYWISSGALLYKTGGTDRSGAFAWSSKATTLAAATQFNGFYMQFQRSRGVAGMLWGYPDTVYTEINADGSWKAPATIVSGRHVSSADLDVAGNLVYLVSDNYAASAFERQRLSSAMRYAYDSTPPMLSASSVRSGKTTITQVVALSADEPANLFFSVTGGTITAGGANTTAEQRYTGPVTVTFPKGSSATIKYRGINMAERWSNPVSTVLQ